MDLMSYISQRSFSYVLMLITKINNLEVLLCVKNIQDGIMYNSYSPKYVFNILNQYLKGYWMML